ncbi:E3 ubiquitin-protein ligase RNF213 isoform X2 [Xenopus laevis]|uniref:RING-type E3 ubiquitin transferase n=1 Tax=Xenopus laevis TaxID=8355 RepID=A0A8J0TTF8_XENLA|nr:E3 ubiquitin-protein ligase RNF213 isoform X2 [Xenopus laevis]
MRCVKCNHESLEVAPKFCSNCAHPMGPVVSTDTETANQGAVMELEPGKELILEDVDEPSSLEDLSMQKSKKKRKKRRKKRNTSKTLEAMASVTCSSSLESDSSAKKPKGISYFQDPETINEHTKEEHTSNSSSDNAKLQLTESEHTTVVSSNNLIQSAEVETLKADCSRGKECFISQDANGNDFEYKNNSNSSDHVTNKRFKKSIKNRPEDNSDNKDASREHINKEFLNDGSECITKETSKDTDSRSCIIDENAAQTNAGGMPISKMHQDKVVSEDPGNTENIRASSFTPNSENTCNKGDSTTNKKQKGTAKNSINNQISSGDLVASKGEIKECKIVNKASKIQAEKLTKSTYSSSCNVEDNSVTAKQTGTIDKNKLSSAENIKTQAQPSFKCSNMQPEFENNDAKTDSSNKNGEQEWSSMDPDKTTMKKMGETQLDKRSVNKSNFEEDKGQANSSRTFEQADDITVYFHVIVSKDFKLNTEIDKVVVRAGKMKEYRDWEDTVCEMNLTRDLKEHGLLYDGCTKIPKGYLDKCIPYKYVILWNKNAPEYEYIYKKAEDRIIVNRALLINSQYVIQKEWHQYDDIVCMKPIKSIIKQFTNFFKSKEDDIVKGKVIAGKVMLESIFSILTSCDDMNLMNFCIQLEQFYFVYKECLVYENIKKNWTSLDFGKPQVDDLILDKLRDICQPFLKKRSLEKAIIKNRLVSGLICLKVAEHHKLPTSKDDLEQICTVLCLEEKSKQELVNELQNAKKIFSGIRGMESCLRSLCQKCIDQGVQLWILVLPVLHAFSDSHKPEQSPAVSTHQEDVWAGLEGLSYIDIIKQCEVSKSFSSNILQMMMNKKYLLQADRTLIRSWLCLLPVENLPKCMDGLPLTFLDILTACCHSFSRGRFATEHVEIVLKKMLLLMDDLKDKSLDGGTFKSLCSVSLKLFQNICKSVMYNYEPQLLCAEIILKLASLQEKCGCPEDPHQFDILQKALHLINPWLKRTCGDKIQYSYSLHKELEIFDRLIKAGENVDQKWNDKLLFYLRERIKQNEPVDQIKMFCREQPELQKHHMSLGKCFEDCAIEAVRLACQREENILGQLIQYHLENFSRLVSAVIKNAWPNDDSGNPIKDYDEILQHVLQWTDGKHILKLYGTENVKISNLEENVQELILLSESVFNDSVNNLMSGKVLHKHLQCILQNQSQFLEICKMKTEKSINTSVKKVLGWRQEELKSLEREKMLVGSLLKMCCNVNQCVQVNVSEIKERQSENLGLQPMNKLLTVKTIESPQPPACKSFYNLSTNIMNMANYLHTYKESSIFMTCWKRQANSLSESMQNGSDEYDENYELTIEDLEEELFAPCIDEYRRIYEDLKSGRVTFEVVDGFLKDYNNHYQKLKDELKIMCNLHIGDQGQWIDTRVKQIQQYHQLHVAFKSARVISNVKNCLELSGDFETLDTLLQFADNFEESRKQPLSCINEEVMKTKEVLSDITEERCICLKELELRDKFYHWVKEELTDINELKVFVELASISAGENDMDVDRVACFHDAVLGYSSLLYDLRPNFGFHQLMKCLQKLWKALDADQNLPRKLRDSARHMDWLKTVKESHGSVELSSLSLATTINKKGIYVIKAPSENKLVTPDTVVHLELPEGDDERNEVHCYSLEELKELLNKLMLMSGKADQGSDEVEKFSEIFSNVQRLVTSFIDLYLAGNILFRKWEASIYCSDNEKYSLKMKFNVETLGEFEGQGNLADLLPDICKMMENLLDQWMDYINKKRTQFYYLNYYTAEQLLYLSQNCQASGISEEALMMLSFIRPECTKADFITAFYSLKFNSSHSLSQEKIMFEFKVQNYTHVLEKLEMIWEFFMTNMNSLFPGCLDIDTLGECLAALANTAEKTIFRNLHSSLQQGCPNLVLCSPSEILLSTVAVYMNTLNQPLPSYDEVLLCTVQTTFEEVELFFRRCLTTGYNGKKIYSLLYADELSYDIAYKAEQLFQQLQKQCGPNYNLVILCNCEREHCYIPSAFSQYKVHITPHKPLPDIQHYLEHHFNVKTDTNSAACVFKNGISAGIVASKRAGVGKSLYVKRLYEKLMSTFPSKNPILKIIRIISPKVDETKILQKLLPFLSREYKNKQIIFHIDITSSVNSGVSEFLFKLFVLQYLSDSEGRIWKRKQCHLYIVEILESSNVIFPMHTKTIPNIIKGHFIDCFPKILCLSPKEVLAKLTENPLTKDCGDPGMDYQEFQSEYFQRPFQYLIRFEQRQNLDTFTYRKGSVEGNPARCLQIILMYCGIIDPSWSELRNFAWFLNLQLKDCESSIFCNHELVGDTLQGFKNFVVNFMILMAKDFATPSLHIADQSPGRLTMNLDGVQEEELAPFLIRKRWESEPHPYIFFNDDHVSMTFIGFHLRINNTGGVDAIDPRNNRVIRENVMTQQLYQGLQLQRVPFNIDFDKLPRDEKIDRLCMVLGIQWPFDPDDTYELTIDNILKILAIKMRFRCGIPVIIMGETGCGKTRLIKFLCSLCKGFAETENMKLVKVHGGTSANMIYNKILEAQEIALFNKQHTEFSCDTVLFFDEANTTDAISSIKEALCDHTVEGKPLKKNSGLRIIAACNPYRKHSDDMIKRLESAGLGYRIRAEETKERLGSIPLRQLVYRVHALPPSMMPLVWDFGQLNNETERKYIQQIVLRLAKEIQISSNDIQLLTDVLSASQSYMRKMKDECSFVSLRDVERCIEVFKWFYNHSAQLVKHLKQMVEKERKFYITSNVVAWSLVLAVGVCYHASLETKKSYRKAICKFFPEPYRNHSEILEEISRVQDLFLSGVDLRETIARNLALKENLFMMVICIELKIPLFLVGKPGSSKSLSKTIVADAMQGQAAHNDLYKDLKQIHLVSFQCSPHSTPEGIIGTFKHCARFQEAKNLKEYVSVVVLDEIGLAEDSPKMPLKTLHPLLEDGCIDDDPKPHKKVGFIGISNWALDPAKMNRGIFVSRGDPHRDELIESATGICSSDKLILGKVEAYLPGFAEAYQKLCETQKKQKKEFFGLRDFYSLIKMVFSFTKRSENEPNAQEVARAVLRNFSGKDEVDALSVFIPEEDMKYIKEINTIDLVMENIRSDNDDTECRYLLVLTRNYAALQILQQKFCTETKQPEVIFGSGFPKDQEYTQICRNINRVKICMETGQMVILLNLQNLYESLYDALNQYYVYLAGQKYVDLGLGTHRVKCRVHQNFRLIVIEEKEVVYKDFAIPLINRLEKHYLDIYTVLTKEQKAIVEELKVWVKDFITAKTGNFMGGQQDYSDSDVFIGYHSDACASVILQVTENLKQNSPYTENITEVKKAAKSTLLNCTTPDAVIRLGNKDLTDEYFKIQKHSSLLEFLFDHANSRSDQPVVFTEITTFSRLLTSADRKILELEFNKQIKSIEILSLQQFDTENSFLKQIRSSLECTAGKHILIIQTDFENSSQAHLVASAKYSLVNEMFKINLREISVFVYFITKLQRMQGGTSYTGFRGGLWQSVHIDDLRKSNYMVSDITALQSLTISQLFCEVPSPEMMEVTLREPVESSRKENLQDTGREMDVEMFQDDNEAPCAMDIEENNADAAMETERERNWNKTEAEMRATKILACQEILDTTMLIRSCLQSAIGMLKDDDSIVSRSTRRIEILITMLSTEDQLKASFLKILKVRLQGMLENQEGNAISFSAEWVVREASNPDALQEAGTFRQTLWKRIQRAVTPFLAQILSVVDLDANLEILVDPDVDDFMRLLWMFIFSNQKLLNISCNQNHSSQNDNITVMKNYMNISLCKGNYVPFSWKIKDYLENIWAQAQYTCGMEAVEMKFVSIFDKGPLGEYISSWKDSERQKLLVCYQRDFILLTMSMTSVQELEFMEFAFSSCIEDFRVSKGIEEVSLPWVHLAFNKFQHRLQTFSRIIAINPNVLDSLASKINELKSPTSSEMILDIFSGIACLEILKNTLVQPNPQAWLRKVKNIQVPIEIICSENYIQDSSSWSKQAIENIRAEWNCVFSMALFVEHVLMDETTQSSEMQTLLIEKTRLLGKCLEEFTDLKSQRPFQVVIDVLKNCREAFGKSVIRFGVSPCPVCQDDPKDPVCLTCDHVYCQSCISQWLDLGHKSCPLCKTELPENFNITVSAKHREAIERNANLRQKCDGFFIDVICTLCFKDSTPPDKDVIIQLLSLLITNKECLIGKSGSKNYTKSLSPFDESVDKNPVIRSVVLKLLLKYSFPEIKNYIQRYLSSVHKSVMLSKQDIREVYMLFVSCLEDSMYEKNLSSGEYNKHLYLKHEEHFLQQYLKSTKGTAHKESSVEFLSGIARIRLALDVAAEIFFEVQSDGANNVLQEVKKFCAQSDNDWYRVYLIRKLANLHGIEAVQKYFKDRNFRWLFPPQLFQKEEDHINQIDMLLVYGNNYKLLRDGIGKALIECKEESIITAQKDCKSPDYELAATLLLAIFKEITMQHAVVNNRNQVPVPGHSTVIAFIQNARVHQNDAIKQFVQSLLNNSRPVLRVYPKMSAIHSAVVGLAMHAAAVLLPGNNKYLEPLRNLAFFPEKMQNSYLPTMPEDLLEKAKTAVPNMRWYVCPQGHYCAVGECGQPMQTSRCIDCGAAVGGEQHMPHAGFTVVNDQGDRTKTGHILGDPDHRGADIASDRGLTTPVYILLRLLTHLSMILGAEKNMQNIRNILNPQVQDVALFLLRHITRDLELLKKILGKSADETTIVVHLILCQIPRSSQQPGTWPVHFDEKLSTKNGRNNWEKQMATIIEPTIQNLNQMLLEVNNYIRKDERISSNPIVKIVYGDPLINGDPMTLPEDSDVHCSRIWSCRKRISIENLRHVVQQKNGKDVLPLLWTFLEKESELRMVKHLAEILNLQKELIKYFQNSSHMELKTINDFLASILSDGARHIFDKRIKMFLLTWNKLRDSVYANSDIKLAKEMCDSDLTEESAFEFILPRRRGKGLCATALVSYLISLHNHFVYEVEKYLNDEQKYSIKASDVLDVHVIGYDLEKDLMPIILSNCQYSVESGGETLQEFDLRKIQRQITNRFLQGKPFIKVIGLPTFTPSHDRNFENIFMDVKKKLSQEPLPNSAINVICRDLNSYSDVCEALHITEVTLGFLAMSGGNEETLLTTYVEEILQMADQINLHILEALKRCHLKHSIALWQLLTALKSEHLLRLKMDPFDDVDKSYKQHLNKVSQQQLNQFLEQNGTTLFLLELHEMIILKLKGKQYTDAFKPAWSLRDVLGPLLDAKDQPFPEMDSDFPEQISLAHCVEAWKVAAARNWNRLQK